MSLDPNSPDITDFDELTLETVVVQLLHANGGDVFGKLPSSHESDQLYVEPKLITRVRSPCRPGAGIELN